jgi:hypothetical protein
MNTTPAADIACFVAAKSSTRNPTTDPVVKKA